MEQTEHKLAVLEKIGTALNSANITWAVGASLLLYLKGIAAEFHDIDLMVAEEDISRAKELLLPLGTLNLPNPSAQYRTRHFLEFSIDGVEVDVMAGFVIVDQGREYDCSLRKDQITGHAMVNDTPIPLHAVALWREYYRLMHRDSKVAMIDRWTGCESNC